MVAVVQIERWKEKNLWEKIRLQIKRYAAAQTDAESPWGEYRVFHVCDRKIRWEQLEKAAGRENMQVLLPDGLAPPAGFPIFSADSFRENLFDTAAKRLLSQLRWNIGFLTVRFSGWYVKIRNAAARWRKACWMSTALCCSMTRRFQLGREVS